MDSRQLTKYNASWKKIKTIQLPLLRTEFSVVTQSCAVFGWLCERGMSQNYRLESGHCSYQVKPLAQCENPN